MEEMDCGRYALIVGKTICVFIQPIHCSPYQKPLLEPQTFYVITTMLSYIQYNMHYSPVRAAQEPLRVLAATTLYPLLLEGVGEEDRLAISYGALLHFKRLERKNMEIAHLIPRVSETIGEKQWVFDAWIMPKIKILHEMYVEMTKYNSIIGIECPKLKGEAYQAKTGRLSIIEARKHLSNLKKYHKRIKQQGEEKMYPNITILKLYSTYTFIVGGLLKNKTILEKLAEQARKRRPSIISRLAANYKIFSKPKRTWWTN